MSADHIATVRTMLDLLRDVAVTGDDGTSFYPAREASARLDAFAADLEQAESWALGEVKLRLAAEARVEQAERRALDAERTLDEYSGTWAGRARAAEARVEQLEAALVRIESGAPTSGGEE